MSTIREIQLFELEMLKDVAKACDENGIEYGLSSGTLLGAVRHGGFIPWDDDVDIFMTLDNYKRFRKIGQTILGDKYFVQNYKTENDYCEFWTQIRANGTTSMPKNLMNYNIHFGICIDIFPVVGIPDNRDSQNRSLSMSRVLLSDRFQKVLFGKIESKKQRLLYLLPRFLRRWICTINEKNIYLRPENYSYSGEVCGKIGTKYPSRTFTNLTKIKFEDTYFNCPSDYDDYLKRLYGDYMKLPPESERSGHVKVQGETIFDTKKSYTEYKKELNQNKISV